MRPLHFFILICIYLFNESDAQPKSLFGNDPEALEEYFFNNRSNMGTFPYKPGQYEFICRKNYFLRYYNHLCMQNIDSEYYYESECNGNEIEPDVNKPIEFLYVTHPSVTTKLLSCSCKFNVVPEHAELANPVHEENFFLVDIYNATDGHCQFFHIHYLHDKNAYYVSKLWQFSITPST